MDKYTHFQCFYQTIHMGNSRKKTNAPVHLKHKELFLQCAANLKGTGGALLTWLSCCPWRLVARGSVWTACPCEGSNVDRHATEEQQEIERESPHAILSCERGKRNHSGPSSTVFIFSQLFLVGSSHADAVVLCFYVFVFRHCFWKKIFDFLK